MSNIDSKIMLNYLLSKLQKPYAYKHNEIYFNVFNNVWERKEKSIEDYYEDELLDFLIKKCDEDKEKLKDLINEIENQISEL